MDAEDNRLSAARRDRMQFLETMLSVMSERDRLWRIVAQSDSTSEAAERIAGEFDVSKALAHVLLDQSVASFTAGHQARIEEEIRTLGSA
jgi:DNA gyrase/topoisomerase IV subunit A